MDMDPSTSLWMIALRVTGALRPEDISRPISLGGPLPAAVRPHWTRLPGWLSPVGAAGATVGNIA